jgi:putative DNA primase/helicase
MRAAAILARFKNIPLTGAPNKEAMFAEYFCDNLYPHVVYTKETGFYVYDFKSGTFQTDFADAVVHRLVLRLAKNIEGFDIASFNKLAGVTKFIAMHPLVFKLESEFDRDDFALNCAGTVYNIWTGETESAAPEKLMKMTARVTPAPASTPVFDKFLGEVCAGDASMAGFLLRFAGYALTGSTREQIFLDLYGGGKNGKTTLLELLLYVLGNYATTIPEDVVVDGGSPTKIENSITVLQNKRLAILADCNRGALNDGMIKKITGGDTLRARQLYRESYEFTPKCKLIIGTNQKLRLRDTGESVKRRLRLVPFDFRVDKPNKSLLDELKAEASGVLYKLLAEANVYARNMETTAFPECERINRESAKYLTDENPFGLFLQESVAFAADASARTVEIWEAYKTWADANGVKPLKKQSLFQELESRGVKTKRVENVYTFDGIRRR